MRARTLAPSIVACALLACGGSAPPAHAPPPVSTISSPPADHDDFEGKPVEPYHSDRLGLVLPLPDRSGWSIVDRDASAGGWLVATHPATSTTIRARKFDTTSLSGRTECVARATLSGELPKEEDRKDDFQTLADEPLRRPKGWDGWRWVAFEPGAAGEIVGHVFLVSGHQHACLVVHVVSRVHSDAEANALADRLELFSSRVIGNVAVDHAPLPPMPAPMLPP